MNNECIKTLERELRHKEKAPAETAALLTLRKKAQAIQGDPEEFLIESCEPSCGARSPDSVLQIFAITGCTCDPHLELNNFSP